MRTHTFVAEFLPVRLQFSRVEDIGRLAEIPPRELPRDDQDIPERLQNPGPNLLKIRPLTRQNSRRNLGKAGAGLRMALEHPIEAADKRGAPLVPNADGRAPKSASSEKAVACLAC